MDFPQTLSLNAWCGEPASGALGADAAKWGIKRQRATPPQPLAADEPVDLRDWQDPRVGWGLVLPDDDTMTPAKRATAQDAPEPIQALVQARGNAPIFRYRADQHNIKVCRYFTNGSMKPLAITGSKRGIGDQLLPRYLLIYAPPKKIPWGFQYVLGQSCFVGRLDLVGDGLENYISALVSDWATAGCNADQPVVWSVNHGHPDITWLMHGAIAKPIADKLIQDRDIGDKLRSLTGSKATATALRTQLKGRSPALVVTTSHGMTGPLDNIEVMRQNLGQLVDDQNVLLDPTLLLQEWQPDGAIWYAHACCSAGSDDTTSYKGLVAAGSVVERVLEAVAGLGAETAPLPKLLLGAQKPLRAFIGQVEPTFDWTLRAETGQVLTDSLCKALYSRMHRMKPEPVGMAFDTVQRHAGELFSQLDNLRRQIARAVPGAQPAATRTHLAALDRQSLVILGDPTVRLPPLGR